MFPREFINQDYTKLGTDHRVARCHVTRQRCRVAPAEQKSSFPLIARGRGDLSSQIGILLLLLLLLWPTMDSAYRRTFIQHRGMDTTSRREEIFTADCWFPPGVGSHIVLSRSTASASGVGPGRVGRVGGAMLTPPGGERAKRQRRCRAVN